MTPAATNRQSLTQMLEEYLGSLNILLIILPRLSNKQLSEKVNRIYSQAAQKLESDFAALPLSQPISLVCAMGVNAEQISHGDLERLSGAMLRAMRREPRKLNCDNADQLVYKSVRLGFGLTAQATTEELLSILVYWRDQEKAANLAKDEWHPFPLK